MREKVAVLIDTNEITQEQQYIYQREDAQQIIKENNKSYLDSVVFIINKKHKITLKDVIGGLEQIYQERTFDRCGPFSVDEVIDAAINFITKESLENLVKHGLLKKTDGGFSLTELGEKVAKAIKNEELQ